MIRKRNDSIYMQTLLYNLTFSIIVKSCEQQLMEVIHVVLRNSNQAAIPNSIDLYICVRFLLVLKC